MLALNIYQDKPVYLQNRKTKEIIKVYLADSNPKKIAKVKVAFHDDAKNYAISRDAATLEAEADDNLYADYQSEVLKVARLEEEDPTKKKTKTKRIVYGIYDIVDASNDLIKMLNAWTNEGKRVAPEDFSKALARVLRPIQLAATGTGLDILGLVQLSRLLMRQDNPEYFQHEGKGNPEKDVEGDALREFFDTPDSGL